jgi:hypothetical protein
VHVGAAVEVPQRVGEPPQHRVSFRTLGDLSGRTIDLVPRPLEAATIQFA